MKSLATLIKLQKNAVDEQRIILGKLQTRLERIEAEIAAHDARRREEEKLFTDHPDMGMTYGAYVRAAILKARALQKQRQSAAAAVEIARDKLAEVFEAQKRYELAEEARLAREEKEEQRRETAFLDEVGSVSFVRNHRKT